MSLRPNPSTSGLDSQTLYFSNPQSLTPSSSGPPSRPQGFLRPHLRHPSVRPSGLLEGFSSGPEGVRLQGWVSSSACGCLRKMDSQCGSGVMDDQFRESQRDRGAEYLDDQVVPKDMKRQQCHQETDQRKLNRCFVPDSSRASF